MHILHTVLDTISQVLTRKSFNNQELLYLVTIFFILMTLMCNSGVILLGEITCLSLLGVKGLTISVNHLKHCRCRQHMIITATGLWISLSVSFFTWGSFSVYPQFFSLTEFSFAFTLYYNWGGNDFWKLGNYEMEQSIQLNVWRARCTLVFNSDISSELRFSQ